MSFKNLASRAAVATIATLVPVVAAVSGAASASATTVHHPSVTVRALPMSQTSGCPQTTNLSARILSNGPAIVRFHWLRSDGTSGRTGMLHFRGSGHHSFDVHADWQVPDDSIRWEQLIVTSPDRVTTRRMSFTTYCATNVYVAYASATDSSALCSDVYTDLGGMIELGGTAPTSLRYYWTVDGTVVGDTTVTDPTTLASGVLSPTFHYAFIASRATPYHDAVLHAETSDGSASSTSNAAYFTTTCA
jgi:hypothetical protein